VTDTITLPRAFVEEMRELIRIAFYNPYGSEFRNPYKHQQAALVALEAALAEPPAKPEPATDKQVNASYRANENGYWVDYRDGWQAAERFHGIRGSK